WATDLCAVTIEVDVENVRDHTRPGDGDRSGRRCEKGRNGASAEADNDCGIRRRVIRSHFPDAPSLVIAIAGSAANAAIPRPIRVQDLTLRVFSGIEHLLERSDLRSRQTRGPLRAFAYNRLQFGNDQSGSACRKVIDNAIFEPV